MLESLIVILLILWLLGWFVMDVGGLIHLLLIVILIVVVLRVLRGGRPLS